MQQVGAGAVEAVGGWRTHTEPKSQRSGPDHVVFGLRFLRFVNRAWGAPRPLRPTMLTESSQLITVEASEPASSAWALGAIV